MASSSFALASTASKISTIGQLRAAMGAVTLTLSHAYARLPEITWVAGMQDEAKFLLDTVNKSAHLLYSKYNDDPDLQSQEIGARYAILAGQVVSQANDALKTVEQAAGLDLWNISDIVDEALTHVGAWAAKPVELTTNGVMAALAAFVHGARNTLLILGAVGVVYVFREPIFRAVRKVAS